MSQSRISRRLRGQDGAAAVEFALIAGVLSMLIFGMMEYGLFFLQSQTLKAGVREGARQAAVGADLTQVRTAVHDGAAGAIPSSSTLISMTPSDGCDGNNTLGTEVEVSIDTTNVNALPAATQQAFNIDIPFLPHLTVHPSITGTFRCEK